MVQRRNATAMASGTTACRRDVVVRGMPSDGAGEPFRSRHGDCGADIHHSYRSPSRAHQVRREASAPRRRRRWDVKIRGCRGAGTSRQSPGTRGRGRAAGGSRTRRAQHVLVLRRCRARPGSVTAKPKSMHAVSHFVSIHSVFAQKVSVVQVVAVRSSGLFTRG